MAYALLCCNRAIFLAAEGRPEFENVTASTTRTLFYITDIIVGRDCRTMTPRPHHQSPDHHCPHCIPLVYAIFKETVFNHDSSLPWNFSVWQAHERASIWIARYAARMHCTVRRIESSRSANCNPTRQIRIMPGYGGSGIMLKSNSEQFRDGDTVVFLADPPRRLLAAQVTRSKSWASSTCLFCGHL
jgi:hypothetical protein